METILAKLTEAFPKSAIKQRKIGGGRMCDYVEGHTVIHRLNDATGNNWSFRVITMERQNDVFLATVELTIPGLGTRQHVGVQAVQSNAGEDLIKGAITDGLKKAATLFGVGLELYGADYAAIEDAKPAAQPAATSPRPANRSEAQRAAAAAQPGNASPETNRALIEKICSLRPAAFPDDAPPWPTYREWLKSKYGVEKLKDAPTAKLQTVLIQIRKLADDNAPKPSGDQEQDDPFKDEAEGE